MATVIRGNEVISSADGTVTTTSDTTTPIPIYSKPHFWAIIIVAFVIGYFIGMKMRK